MGWHVKATELDDITQERREKGSEQIIYVKMFAGPALFRHSHCLLDFLFLLSRSLQKIRNKVKHISDVLVDLFKLLA